MVKSDSDSPSGSWTTFQHIRRTRSSPLGIFLISVIAIVVTLPMISCMQTVSADQYTIQQFRKIGCKGLYNRMSLKTLSQICLDHSEGYHDTRYKECRKNCFTTAAFQSSAAMHDFVLMNRMNADAWQIYLNDIWMLNGFDPRIRRA